MNYSDYLNDILTKLEIIYSSGMHPDEILASDIPSFIEQIFEYKAGLTEEEIASMNEQSSTSVKALSHLYSSVYFEGVAAVLYDNFPNASDLSKILLYYTKATYFSNMSPEKYKEFIAHLSYIEEEYVEHKFNNSFRCLKMLLFMLTYANYVGVSVLSRLILHQMAIVAGIR